MASDPRGEEGTSVELLKNTPGNIARLEDEIEHCKGRQKYLARTRSPSDGEDVRWYFCKVPLADKELAASVPRTEIVGKSDYFRFSMRDSLALEASFLQREEELLSYWWREYAECSEGPTGSCTTSNVILDCGSDENELYLVEEERVGVPVKGGLYEVDLIKRHCFPVYWHGDNRRVLRGHWFARKGGPDWLPLRENVAEQLELAYHCQVWHRRTFQPSGLFAARVDLQGTAQGLHALFTGEDDTWEAWLVFDNAGFGLKMGRGHGIKLRRGFSLSGATKPTQDELRQQKEEEMDDYCSQVPVGHLVFMVHGIGQRLEKANLVDDVGDFRRITASLAETHLSPYQRSIQRVLFIPCQWRKGLKLSSESAVEKVTLDGVRGLRVTLSATVHDVLYYMSPIHCQDIVDSVSNQLNRLYTKFIRRNPGYDGKVSIYGHSLGSVLSYDILCHQQSLSAPLVFESSHVEGSRERESQFEATGQPSTSNSSISAENNSTIHDSSSGLLKVAKQEENSMGSLYSVIHGDNIEDICSIANPIPSVNMVEDLSERTGIFSIEGGSHESILSHTDDGKCISATSMDEANKNSDQQEERIGSDAITNAPSGMCEAITVTTAGEENIEKSKSISSLEEEVMFLKLRIAELEQSSQSTFVNLESDVRNKSCQSKDEEAPRKTYAPYIKYTKLHFKVDTFFAAGSPLGVFLSLRNVRIGIGKGQDYWQDEQISEEMPCCQQMFNIFHPFDPVAYRVEPLICEEYIRKRPVIIPYHRGGKRLHIGFQEFTEDIAARSHAIASQWNSMKVKVVNVFKSRMDNEIEEAEEDIKGKERSYGSLMIERLTGSEDGRIDHVLQDKTFQHPYISVLGAHTNYWRDPDTALFMLKHLYRDIPEEPHEQASTGGGSQSQGGPISLFYDKDYMDEDTPLTFSESSLVREFSRKAKKAMNTSSL